MSFSVSLDAGARILALMILDGNASEGMTRPTPGVRGHHAALPEAGDVETAPMSRVVGFDGHHHRLER